MQQLELFEAQAPSATEYRPLADDLDNSALVAAVERYNASGDAADLWAMWPAVRTAAAKIVNKRLGLLRTRDRGQIRDEIALQFFERLQRYRARGTPYKVRRAYTVLWNLSTWVIYRPAQQQLDREDLTDRL